MPGFARNPLMDLRKWASATVWRWPRVAGILRTLHRTRRSL